MRLAPLQAVAQKTGMKNWNNSKPEQERFPASAQAVPLGPQSLTPLSPTHTPGTPVPVPPFR